MKTLFALLFFVCIPSFAQDLSLPLQALLSDRSVGSLLAHEHNNQVDVSQLGNSNQAELSQSGSGNLIALFQFGSNNSSKVVQEGQGNVLSAAQAGNDHKLDLEQLGNDNHAYLGQLGVGTKLNIQQHGDDNLLSFGIYSPTPMDSALTIKQSGNMQDLLISIY